MEIDLTDINTSKLKADTIYFSISNINRLYNFKYLIMPVSIYNIIERNLIGTDEPIYNNIENENVDIHFVGLIGNLICYVDYSCHPNQIFMKYDSRTSRDNKLNSILNNKNIISEIIIEIIQ